MWTRTTSQHPRRATCHKQFKQWTEEVMVDDLAVLLCSTVLTPALSVSTPIISARNCCGKLKSFPENLYLHKSQGNGIVLEENSKRKPLRYGKAGRVLGGKGCRNLNVRREWNGVEWDVWISRLTRPYMALLEKSWCNRETECSSAPENLLEVQHWQFPRNPHLFGTKR